MMVLDIGEGEEGKVMQLASLKNLDNVCVV